MDIERGSTRSSSVENSLWKRKWNCRKTDSRVTLPEDDPAGLENAGESNVSLCPKCFY